MAWNLKENGIKKIGVKINNFSDSGRRSILNFNALSQRRRLFWIFSSENGKSNKRNKFKGGSIYNTLPTSSRRERYSINCCFLARRFSQLLMEKQIKSNIFLTQKIMIPTIDMKRGVSLKERLK